MPLKRTHWSFKPDAASKCHDKCLSAETAAHTISGHFCSQANVISPYQLLSNHSICVTSNVLNTKKVLNTRKKCWQEIPISPQPLLLLLSQLHVPLDHFQDVLGLIICQARQVQLPAHRSWPQHVGLLLVRKRRRDGGAAAGLGAEAGTTLGKDRGMEKLKMCLHICKINPLIYT